jgi:tRNA modification GTPase
VEKNPNATLSSDPNLASSTNDTIIALATPPGSGGVAIVRISGPQAAGLLSLLHSRGTVATERPRELVLGRAGVAGESGDALAVFMPGPRSYTGDDVAELQLHAGRAVVESVLSLGVSLGARPAEPGEFTRRAYMAGKYDLAQAEAVADLVAAESAAAASMATAQLSGRLSKRVGEVRSRIVDLAASLAANLDFGEEDLPDIDMAQVGLEVEEINSTLSDWLSDAGRGAIIREGFRVAILGLPNAGKSSLLNALVGYDRAIVTDVAGTTRDTLEETIQIDGLVVRLTDTAGITETGDHVEQIGVDRAQLVAAEAALILLLCPADQDPEALVGSLPAGVEVLGVQTQVDRLDEAVVWPEVITSHVRVSAHSGLGLDDLRRGIRRAALGTTAVGEPPLLSSLRHAQAVTGAVEQLESARTAIAEGLSMDIVAGELVLAADALGQITGDRVDQDVVDSIFRNFCIGK